MDASNPAEFDTKMESLSEEWKKRHPQGERFLTYLTKYKAEEIKKTMTAEVRCMAGFGSPPGVYDQNGNECMNSVLQRSDYLCRNVLDFFEQSLTDSGWRSS